MKVKSTVAIGIVIALCSFGVFAQDKEPEKMGGMMKEQDAELDKLVSQMNSAQGEQKMSAMAAVVSKLVELRKKDHEDMAAMHKKTQSEMESRKKEKAETGPSDEHSKHHP